MPAHDTAIVWFRRDLRLVDNPALRYAVENARHIVPVFIHAPEEELEWAPGAASRWWLHHSLSALQVELAKRGSRLVIRRGPTEEALSALTHEVNASLVAWNRLYEPAIRKRDTAIEVMLAPDLEVSTHNANLLFEPGTVRNGSDLPYKVFTAFWRKVSPQLDGVLAPKPAPRHLHGPQRWPNSMAIDALKLLPPLKWDAGFYAEWTPGESGALKQLRTFARVAKGYDTLRNRPDMAGTSRMSPHLHFGEIGPRQIIAQLRHTQAAHGSVGLDTYEREIGWREFSHHLLHDFPHTADKPLDVRFERMQWSRRKSLLHAWQRGMTGYPIVDAGLRELWHTGWMHNRVRMIVASLLTKNLQQHWLSGARWFWDTLVDADLANNTLGWQWTAGCGADASPYYRIFNPILQAERFDPKRAYIRQWIPELARLPDRWIHHPWDAPPVVLASAGIRLGAHYPKPAVDFKRSRTAALTVYRRIQPPKT